MAGAHYVDNKKLYQVLVEYKRALNNGEFPSIPDYVGECLLQIATKLSNKPNFANYTFRDDMISDAVENGLLYLHNFDPQKSQNPFAYFTQITHYAFIRRIEREKKYVYTKLKYALHKNKTGEDHTSMTGESYDIKDPTWTGYDNVHDFIYNYEQKISKARASRVDDIEEEFNSFDSLDEDEIVLNEEEHDEYAEDTNDEDIQ